MAHWAYSHGVTLGFSQSGVYMLHAAWNKLPRWPYVGAVPFARRQVKDERIPYRKLLRLLRADPNAAVRKVLSMQRP